MPKKIPFGFGIELRSLSCIHRHAIVDETEVHRILTLKFQNKFETFLLLFYQITPNHHRLSQHGPGFLIGPPLRGTPRRVPPPPRRRGGTEPIFNFGGFRGDPRRRRNNFRFRNLRANIFSKFFKFFFTLLFFI